MSILAPLSPERIFHVDNLTKTYHLGEVEVDALQGIDLELFSGELIVLLGASGSGKSTLMNIMGGLDTCTSGHVFYKEQNLTTANDKILTEYRRYAVGFVFQFYNLIPSLTAWENVAVVTEIAKNPMDPLEALDLVGLADRANHFPSQLSGGQQQRIAIARAIAKRPEVLLCDEPTGALDSVTGVAVLGVIEKINEQLGTSTVLITHNADIAKMADRVVHIHDGRITAIETNLHKIKAENLSW